MSGLSTLIDERLAVPFGAQVPGVDASVDSVDLTEDGQIVVVCSRGRFWRAGWVLGLPVPAPRGAQWATAYRSRAAGAPAT